MKNLLIILSIATLFILSIATLFYSCESKKSENTEEASVVQNGIRWTGENPTANYLAIGGLNHYENIELANAFTLWNHAVKADSSLFAPHTMLALMSRGEKSDYHKQMAKKFVANENETSKLFVSLVDIPRDSTGRDARRSTWAKMHELSNGPFIHYMYARSYNMRDDNAKVIEELDKLIAFADENKMNTTSAAANNLKGYALQLGGNLEAGTAAIDRALKLYPDGYNPIDSRAEFYLLAGDTTNAIAWYRKVLEKYPYSQSAQNTLRELESKK